MSDPSEIEVVESQVLWKKLLNARIIMGAVVLLLVILAGNRIFGNRNAGDVAIEGDPSTVAAPVVVQVTPGVDPNLQLLAELGAQLDRLQESSSQSPETLDELQAKYDQLEESFTTGIGDSVTGAVNDAGQTIANFASWAASQGLPERVVVIAAEFDAGNLTNVGWEFLHHIEPQKYFEELRFESGNAEVSQEPQAVTQLRANDGSLAKEVVQQNYIATELPACNVQPLAANGIFVDAQLYKADGGYWSQCDSISLRTQMLNSIGCVVGMSVVSVDVRDGPGMSPQNPNASVTRTYGMVTFSTCAENMPDNEGQFYTPVVELIVQQAPW